MWFEFIVLCVEQYQQLVEVHLNGDRCNHNVEYCKQNGDWNTKLPLQSPAQLQRKVHTLSQKKHVVAAVMDDT